MTKPCIPDRTAVRVFVVDSSRIGSQSLAAALTGDRVQVVYSGADAQEALRELACKHADVALISATLEGVPNKGYELAGQIRTGNSNARIVLLLETPDRESVVQAFRSGARGVLSRDSSLDSLTKCISCVHQGQVWATSEEMRHLLEALVAPPRLRLVNARGAELLAPREQEVVHWVSEGLTNREIADRLGLSENTIKNYIFRIFDKIGISKRVELILYAANQLAPPSPKAAAEPDPATTFADDVTLFRWCREAAERLAMVPHVLGEHYRDGRGTQVDKVTALMWFIVAEQVSQEFAAKSRQASCALQRQLTTNEVAEAKRRAWEWISRRQQKPHGQRDEFTTAA